MNAVEFTVIGEPMSLKNNKTLGDLKTSKKNNLYRPIVNNKQVQSYQRFFTKQIPWQAMVMFDCQVRVIMKIYYSSLRPDLDEAIILDCMQPIWGKNPVTGEKILTRRGVYLNDRQVDQKFIFKGKDKLNPRTEIIVEPLEAQQNDLFEDTARGFIARHEL